MIIYMFLCLAFAVVLAIAPLTLAWVIPVVVVVALIVGTYFAPKVRAWLKKERTVAHEGVEKVLHKKY